MITVCLFCLPAGQYSCACVNVKHLRMRGVMFTTLLRKIAVAVEGDGQSCAARLRCRAASDRCYTSVDLWSRTSTPASPAAGDIVRPQVSCNDSEIFHFIYRNIPLIHTGRGEIYHSASHCSSRRLYCNGRIGRVYMIIRRSESVTS